MHAFLTGLTTLALASGCTLAAAHVGLAQPQAAAGSAYTATLRIGHGCDGSPTHTVVVHLPAGLRGARPQPKPGWTLTLLKAPLAQAEQRHGHTVTDEVVALRWEAASRAAWLDDAWFDEFSLRVQLPAQPGPLWLRVQQLCEQGALDWAELPVGGGTSTQGLKAPAVLLQVLPAATATVPTPATAPTAPASGPSSAMRPAAAAFHRHAH